MNNKMIIARSEILEKSIILAFFFASTIVWTPLIPAFLNINTGFVYLSIIFFLLLFVFINYGIKKNEIVLALLIEVYFILLAIITQSDVNFNRYVLFPFGLLIAWNCARDARFMDEFSKLLTGFVGLGVIFGWISFFYVLQGGNAFFEFPNVDGRINGWYLTSLSNAVINGVARISFIYDEPGAFSFVICIAVILRELLNKNRTLSMFIISGGVITFSFIHVIITTFYFLLVLNGRYKIILLLIVASFASYTLNDSRFEFFYDRFQKSDDVGSGFNNRTVQLSNFAKVVNDDPSVLFLGDYKCHDRELKMCVEHGDISSSIATPIYQGGMWMFVFQFFTHALLIFLMFKRKFLFAAFSLSLLLLQRPYFSQIGYQLLIYISVFYMTISSGFLRRRVSKFQHRYNYDKK
ncbi:hypothetical protein [Pectobacterium versatile]|uniref:Uncharacterized protein n=1 Tax=Pectobacterium versatile TaxID=2488639 RepID=A0AAW3RW59_9GAMM|nr:MULTISPECIES: hypothetical protein [Pectobacterium]MBA0161253.1 hypothetical protein [Pectobacterium versatile]MBN3238218.1 hypothetical protein [Pectobacterium versatile]MBQ4763685.1 hypothetical protein [Pectobacterium versatile]MCL6386618.1 hypothetical protein [Pectobacterium carotovorum subsp. carotovorum]RJL55685.1 hypothetical protein D5076_17040 [Pectobacterium versatile]